ncbi:MAG: acetyl-CoA carboxylase biotin carboxylase subunit [Deltaproteobacteria bacterium]|nr:acetyl-CoA carboxylase biotin carboxylase subunit [Deltaproteobacteria bacterium]
MKKIKSVLVANRGEIAVRVIRACQALGIAAIAVVSEADRESLSARMADRVLCIGPAQAAKSYLDIPTLVAAALGAGADAIHPGYGFLAERPDFAETCVKHGLIFIGPKALHIRQMGDKLLAREMVAALHIPVIPGSCLVRDLQEAVQFGEKTGYPLLLKAAAGGGGRGMKILQGPEELKILFNEASAEAGAAFGDDRLYIERYVPHARHIEVQILGDCQGNIIHLFERDCSLQRRYQKILEEAPSTVLTPEQRLEVCEAALLIARRIRYESAGTVEFILDQDEGRFYFLEMNTRIQVEHPVTEMITGLDLIQEQIRIAGGDPLRDSQADITARGHAIECRINAESPERQFSPSPGRITQWQTPDDPFVRVDSHCYEGYVVPPFYDSLLAKIIAHGKDRREAIERMQTALSHFLISGVETTMPLHRRILMDDAYRAGKINTCWLEKVFLGAVKT